MKRLNRRGFIRSGVGLGAAAGAALGTSSARALFDPPAFWTYRTAVVVGSGFGGSVAALRLGQAGIHTTVVERGKNWAYQGENTFPVIASSQSGDGRGTWLSDTDAASGALPVGRYPGMLERVAGDTTDSVCGAGLGGGSLVYGGVLLQPRRELFESVFPSLDYDEMDQEFYPRVLSLVSGGTIPDDILESPTYAGIKNFIAGATAAGMDVTRSHVGFDWNVIRREIQGEITPYASVGEYVFGCNSNAKNTLDKNYLRLAAETGRVRIAPLHHVTTITEDSMYGYAVRCDVLDEAGEVVYRHNIACKYLFMAAGSLNTTKLLLKAKEAGDLADINDAVGQLFGGNGDELMGRLVYNPAQNPVQGGPPCVAAHDPANPIKTVGFMHSPSNQRGDLPEGVRMQLHMAMSVPDQLGQLTYDPSRDQPYVSYPFEENAQDRAAHYMSLAKLPHVDNGVIPGTAIGSAGAIWHPLGGVVMGEACSDLGELLGKRNLFVVDGSLMPGSTAAANPSLTIAANAERIMQRLVPQLS